MSISRSFLQTKKIGEKLAKKILGLAHLKTAFIIGLNGQLGAGKTTFLQGLVKGLGIKERINSPTFVIMKRFKIKDLRFKFFYHFDCYRLQKPKDILALGFGEIVDNPQNIVAIEWSEKINNLLPKTSVLIKFKLISKNVRKIVFAKRELTE